MFFILTYIFAQIDMFEHSFALVNQLHPNKAITLYNVESKNQTLPLRLSAISNEKLHSQLFMMRFNLYKHFWLSNILKPLYRSVNGYPYLIAKLKSPEPNLNLKYMGVINGDKVYKITSEDKCMTVGEENSIGYHPIEFSECANTPAQNFVFIPRIVLEKYLKNDTDLIDENVYDAYSKLYKDLQIARNAIKN